MLRSAVSLSCYLILLSVYAYFYCVPIQVYSQSRGELPLPARRGGGSRVQPAAQDDEPLQRHGQTKDGRWKHWGGGCWDEGGQCTVSNTLIHLMIHLCMILDALSLYMIMLCTRPKVLAITFYYCGRRWRFFFLFVYWWQPDTVLDYPIFACEDQPLETRLAFLHFVQHLCSKTVLVSPLPRRLLSLFVGTKVILQIDYLKRRLCELAEDVDHINEASK